MWDLFFALYVLYLLYIVFKDTPLEATMWYYLAKDWQRMARLWGECGLLAEKAYHDAMRRKSLA